MAPRPNLSPRGKGRDDPILTVDEQRRHAEAAGQRHAFIEAAHQQRRRPGIRRHAGLGKHGDGGEVVVERLAGAFARSLSGEEPIVEGCGRVDRVLMAINDSIMVIPHFPILVLFYFVLKDEMNWLMLVLILSALGWSYDARLIRSIAMSLRTRPFTTQSVYSGMSMRKILVEEHLPYVMPIVFATTMNNMIWSIGMEITLSASASPISTPRPWAR